MQTPTDHAHLVLCQLIRGIFRFLDGDQQISTGSSALSRVLSSKEISGLALACGRLGLLSESNETSKLRLESAQQELQLPFRILPGAVDSLVSNCT